MKKRNDILAIALLLLLILIVISILVRDILETSEAFNSWIVDNILDMFAIYISIFVLMMMFFQIQDSRETFNYTRDPKVAIEKISYKSDSIHVIIKNFSNSPAYHVNCTFDSEFNKKIDKAIQFMNQRKKELEKEIENEYLKIGLEKESENFINVANSKHRKIFDLKHESKKLLKPSFHFEKDTYLAPDSHAILFINNVKPYFDIFIENETDPFVRFQLSFKRDPNSNSEIIHELPVKVYR